MKVFLLLASVYILPSLVLAQTEKGQGIWTGSASFVYSSLESDQINNAYFSHSTSSTLSFNRGVFFKNNWLAGGGLNMTLTTMKVGSSTLYRTNTNVNTGLNGFVRRYWGKEKWRVFLGGGLSLGYGSNNYSGENAGTTDENSFTVNPFSQVGATYYLTDRIGFEASATSTSFPFNFNSLGIGLTILTGVKSGNSTGNYEAPQTAKGRWVLGGTFEFRTDGSTPHQPGTDASRGNTFTVAPSVGWFVKKNLLVGVMVPLLINWSKETHVYSYGISPYLKKYISDNRLRPFVEGELNYSVARSKSNGVNNPLQKIASVNVKAGLAYMLGDRFIVEAALGGVYFNRIIFPKEANLNAWTTGLSASLQPDFSIVYVFD
jgi:hypothetical protein